MNSLSRELTKQITSKSTLDWSCSRWNIEIISWRPRKGRRYKSQIGMIILKSGRFTFADSRVELEGLEAYAQFWADSSLIRRSRHVTFPVSSYS